MRPIAGIFGLLILANAAAWAWALVAFHGEPVLLGMALLASTLGLRHAVDADHIAAIDNVTRKFLQTGRRPLSVGLFFALGHSTVVALAVAGLAVAVPLLGDRFESWRHVGGLIGTMVSVLFLLAIAAANLVSLRSNWRALRTTRRGDADAAQDLDSLSAGGGLLARLCRPLVRLITQPWHMFFLGFLFGLGFDTATEVALLGLSASQAAQGMSIWMILVFPALFAAAMALIDTADGVLMLRAYGWAFDKPARRLRYNLAITLISVVVAVAVAGFQLLGLIGEEWGPTGAFWDTIGRLNDHTDGVGLAIIGVFVAIWIGAMLLHRSRRAKGGEAAAD
jgi:nickel/cobalt transporter (NiCoT) family protein